MTRRLQILDRIRSVLRMLGFSLCLLLRGYTGARRSVGPPICVGGREGGREGVGSGHSYSRPKILTLSHILSPLEDDMHEQVPYRDVACPTSMGRRITATSCRLGRQAIRSFILASANPTKTSENFSLLTMRTVVECSSILNDRPHVGACFVPSPKSCPTIASFACVPVWTS